MRSRSLRITIWGLWRKSEKEGGKEGEKEGGVRRERVKASERSILL